MTGLFIEQGRLLSTWSWSSWSCAVAVGLFGHRNSFSSHGFDSAGDRTLFGLRFSRFGSGLVRSVAPSDLLWLQRAESSSARFNQLRDGARAEGSGETAIYYGRPSPYRGAVSVQEKWQVSFSFQLLGEEIFGPLGEENDYQLNGRSVG